MRWGGVWPTLTSLNTYSDTDANVYRETNMIGQPNLTIKSPVTATELTGTSPARPPKHVRLLILPQPT